MDPILLLNQLPLWVLAPLILAIAIFYSVGLLLLCRKVFGVSRLQPNNEVAGFKFAVVGVAYAVLLAFVVIAVWEEYRNTETAVRNEAKAILDLHGLSRALPEPTGSDIRAQLTTYAAQVCRAGWPAMADGQASLAVTDALEQLRQAILGLQPQNDQELAKYQHALHLLMLIGDNRSERLNSAAGSVPPVIWLVLLAGALLNLGYPAFFAASNAIAQSLMTAALAALIALTLLLAVLLAYPFAGAVHIPPEPFEQALQQMLSRQPGMP